MSEEYEKPDIIEIPATDEELLAQCRVETFMAGGKGGQHQNRTESGVRLVHLPSGVSVVSREERSQHRNKARALERLRTRLEKRNQRPTPRKPTRVPEAERRRRLQEKRKRARLKEQRRKPPSDPDS